MSVNGDGAEPLVTEVQTLFLVVLDLDGQSRVVLDQDAHFAARRLATPKDVYPCLANILADYQAIKTAEAVVSFQTVMARQFVEAQAAEALESDAAD